jgi:hypothetical protein
MNIWQFDYLLRHLNSETAGSGEPLQRCIDPGSATDLLHPPNLGGDL